MKNKTTPRSGFTLIELLTVIAIIGILAAILIPAVGKVREVANKTKSSSNIRSIAVSHATYSTSGGRVKVLRQENLPDDSIYGVAEFLAKQVDLVDAAIWMIPSDEEYINYSGTIPSLIGYRDEQTNAFTTSADWTGDEPIAYAFALRTGGNDPTSTTPLTWTRGLDLATGVWGTDSPWGNGGHIAFLDGHVVFYNELDVASEDEYLVEENGDRTASMTDIHVAADIKEYTPQ